jgi:dienelactone hydrolase
MKWTSNPLINHNVTTREFEVASGDHLVPVIVWTPTVAPDKVPLVLIGHGGSQHKSDTGITELAHRFVKKYGFAVAAIDGPIHGARRNTVLTGPAMQAEFRVMWEQDTRIDSMVKDWQIAIDALISLKEFDPNSIGWYGVSMGTSYGLPLVASDHRIKAALLGMWGTNYPNSQRLADDAPKILCPVLFQMKWDDQFFTREGQIDLFDRLGSEQKWLKVYMGGHVPVDGQQLDDIEDFLARKLQT